MTIYHNIALNSVLPPLSYHYPRPLQIGTRVVVTLNGKTQIGLVWQTNIQPNFNPDKILPIMHTFEDEPMLPESWIQLIQFTARYYHYPIGQTAFSALAPAFKENKPLVLPTPPQYYTLNSLGKQQPAPPTHHHKQYHLWQALLSGSHSLAELKKIHHKAAEILDKYIKKQWIDINSEIQSPSPLVSHTHNPDQIQAIHTICQTLNQFQPYVLHGITGSGKTEVYFETIAKALAHNKQVLFMLPEINLTPQLLHRIAQRFPNTPTAVLHSQMSHATRNQNYLNALQGQAKLIIGTRLSVFTPCPQLGLIIVDEEHDSSFKQDNELRYHARNLAVWRAQQAQCPIILGSATPSLETWHKVQIGAYQLLSLPKRAIPNAQPPKIEILDIRKQSLNNGIASHVLQKLQDNYHQGGLSMVYLNRRGFSPALFCSDCGHIFGCPNCSSKMVLHQRVKQLRCHHCDFRQPIPNHCPSCGNQDLTPVGQGTQRIEETLRQTLPNARIARVDRDSTNHKHDWEQLYQAIHRQEIDLLIGTQMLAKGHDFPQLNLVVIINADNLLFSNDFRATERLFSELMQVSGRAGRASHTGQVIIQTKLPEHPIFTAIRNQDYAQFANEELKQRELFQLPPYYFQAAIRADAPKLNEATEFLNQIRDQIATMLPEHVTQLGSIPMQLTKLAQRERAQIFIESPNRKSLHHTLSLWQQLLSQNKNSKIRWHIDVDNQEI